MSNSLDLDQDRHSVECRPDLDPNCSQRLSADDEICRYQGKSLHFQGDIRLNIGVFHANQTSMCLDQHLN